MNGYRPSSSTVLSFAIGAPLAIVIAWAVKEFAHVEMPAEVSTALGAVISAAIGYFGAGGRHADVAPPPAPESIARDHEGLD